MASATPDHPMISIVIPTVRRPDPLAAAAGSALALNLEGLSAELVIVDNDPAASAREWVEGIATSASIPIRYVHAPEPGVANARNAGVAAAQGRFIAFLDDDEIAPPGWLKAMVEVQARFEADAVFGPVRTRLPDGPIRHRDYFAGFFARFGPEEACTILSGPGCGCSLVRVDALPHPTEPFSASRNGSGGEDDLLFSIMKADGARFAWAPEAWVWEVPDRSRVRLGYTLRRAFAYGQGPCSAAAAKGPGRWLSIPFWMAFGALQMVLYGARAAVDLLTRSPALPFTLDRVAQGLGKILWFPPFKIGFYGQAALARSEALLADGDSHERHQPLDAGPEEGLRPSEPLLQPRAG